MNDIIREALEAYKLIAEDMHDNVDQCFSDDIDIAIKALSVLDADVKEAYICGYERGHNDTVESCYDPESVADEYIAEVVSGYSGDPDSRGSKSVKVYNLADPPAPTITAEDAALLMELMMAGLQGEDLALLGRLSEHQLYNKLAALLGTREIGQ